MYLDRIADLVKQTWKNNLDLQFSEKKLWQFKNLKKPTLPALVGTVERDITE